MSKKRTKKKHTGLKVLLGIIIVAGIAAGGLWGYQKYTQMKEQQEAAKRQAELEESYQQEVASMQGVYKEWASVVDTPVIYSGITAMGIDLSGMTEEEASEALADYYSDAVLDRKIVLDYEGKKWEYTYKDLGFSANTDDIAEAAYGLCRTGSLRERYGEIQALSTNPVDLMLSDGYDASTIDDILDTIAEEVDQDAKDASMKYEDGKFVVTDDVKGYHVDKEATKEALTEELKNQQDIHLDLVIEDTEPEVTAEMFEGFGDIIGSFNTYYSMDNHPRNKNLEVGCSRITGTLMMPGDSFNYNDTVSPVDTASGYMESSTIVNGEYVPGIGGGLCQVSTTLYNAVIRAELTVTERYPHSLEPGYVPNGQDAAIAIGGKNFQFVNSSEHPIYIVMSAYGGTLNATIFGIETRDPSRTVTFESEKTGTIAKPDPIITKDDSMYEDEKEVTSAGREGLTYDCYKVVTENGSTTREYFNSSTYYPVADRITVGTKKREESSQEESSQEESSTEETSTSETTEE